jgi:hypothetical protein
MSFPLSGKKLWILDDMKEGRDLPIDSARGKDRS